MCGRFEAFTREQIEEVIDDIAAGRLQPVPHDAATDLVSTEGFPQPEQARPATTTWAIGPQKLQIAQYRWGVPRPGTTKLIINARIESRQSLLWTQAFENGRVIVPARAYFEPHETQTEQVNGKMRKRQYRFSASNGRPLLMAGIMLAGRLAIVTTDATADIAHIHPRMPLLLDASNAAAWITGPYEGAPHLEALDLVAQPEREEAQLKLF